MPELGTGDIFMLLKGLSPDAMAIAMGFYALAQVANLGMGVLNWFSSRANRTIGHDNGAKLDAAKQKLDDNTMITAKTEANVNGTLSNLIFERDNARLELAKIAAESALLKAQLAKIIPDKFVMPSMTPPNPNSTGNPPG